MRDFDAWLKQFRDSISDYRYYINFKKVIEQKCTPIIYKGKKNELNLSPTHFLCKPIAYRQ